MTRLTGDDLTMAGLHRLAVRRGDGLAPELLALFADLHRAFDGAANVVQFPLTGMVSARDLPAEDCNIVIPFPALRGR